MMANITFLSFLLFSMCHSIHVAVNTWLNCSFLHLLVINGNLGPILHRFRDTAVYWSKYLQNRQFVPTPVSEIALARGDPYRIS